MTEHERLARLLETLHPSTSAQDTEVRRAAWFLRDLAFRVECALRHKRNHREEFEKRG